MKKTVLNHLAASGIALSFLLSGCSTADPGAQSEKEPAAFEEKHSEPSMIPEGEGNQQLNHQKAESEENDTMLRMKINDTAVAVNWEENESVEALKEQCRNAPLTIQMSMYGGFEQVGPIGQSLPRNDSRTTTRSGDIVLYSGNQIVVFYGSNTWSYTRLGHIIDQSEEELTELLGNGDVTMTFEMGKETGNNRK